MIVVGRGIHVPACVDLEAHIRASVAETQGTLDTLDDFIARLRADWQDEQLIADAGDDAVMRYWAAVDADHMLRFV